MNFSQGKARHRQIIWVLLAIVAACSVASHALAEAPKPPPRPPPPPGPPRDPLSREVSDLRERFSRRALSAGRTLAEQYANALASLESQAADAGDYETALHAR